MFTLKTYGRTELAQCYFPGMTAQGAWQKLRGWLRINPRLRTLLDNPRRTFCPNEVKLIITELGEP